MWQRIKTKLVAAWLAASLLWRSFLALFEGTHSMAEPKKTPAPVGHNPVSYPKEIPMHCIGHIIGHLRGTETLALPDLGQHITTTVGCGLEFMKTTPQPVGAKSTENFSAMSDDEVADKLETLTAPQAVGAAPEAFPVWLLPILFDVFRRYFGF